VEDFLYHYKAFVTRVIDGDTIEADIDLGLGVWVKGMRIRLYGINAPEIRGDEAWLGVESKNWLSSKVLNREIVLKTVYDRRGKFGRLLGEVWLDSVNINQKMVEQGLAKEVDY